jgi:hypothetical protein
VRRLGIDVANLTTQMAFLSSSLEVVQQTASTLTPDLWTRTMLNGDGEDPQADRVVQQITITGDQADNLMRLLAAIDALS